jgi:hypothetical protein
MVSEGDLRRHEQSSDRLAQGASKKIVIMLYVFLAVALGFAAQPQKIPALPAGVKSVSFGQAQRSGAAGKGLCAIVRPLPHPPVFERGVLEIAYTVELEPVTVKSASARVAAPAGQELRTSACNAFTPIKGGLSQTQLGSSISRTDKAPLLPGAYSLRITVDGQVAEIPFTVGR